MTSERASFDRQMMAIALTMARRGLGLTAPNPSVGAVIADEESGEVIARAVTAPGGRPHAEPRAIADAGERARGKTIYVTLEPCSHFGKTPPCADAIISAGLKRAVIALEDPDPRVSGRGLDRLRAAGIDVVRGVGADEARWITRGHIVRVTERRPFITLKLALDAHGDIARGHDGAPVWVTGEQARASGHLLRALHDAILVGSGTVRADNPQLTCRLPGLEARSPLRVALSRKLDLSLDARLLDDAGAYPVLCVAGFGVDESLKDRFEARGADVAEVTTVAGNLWLPAVMEALVARGITRLLVEGGPSVWRAFAQSALLDEIVLYMAGRANEQAAHAALEKQLGDCEVKLFETQRLDTDTMYRFRRATLMEGR